MYTNSCIYTYLYFYLCVCSKTNKYELCWHFWCQTMRFILAFFCSFVISFWQQENWLSLFHAVFKVSFKFCFVKCNDFIPCTYFKAYEFLAILGANRTFTHVVLSKRRKDFNLVCNSWIIRQKGPVVLCQVLGTKQSNYLII